MGCNGFSGYTDLPMLATFFALRRGHLEPPIRRTVICMLRSVVCSSLMVLKRNVLETPEIPWFIVVLITVSPQKYAVYFVDYRYRYHTYHMLNVYIYIYISMPISGTELLEVPTIYKACFSGLCKGISPQNMAQKMILTYLHFWILKFPLGIESIYKVQR